MLYVLVGPFRRRDFALDRSIFRWQAKCIPTHGLEHVTTAHALISAHDITDGVVPHVTHVKVA